MIVTLSIPVLFAVGGVALIALAAFGPRKSGLEPVISFAPPPAPDRARWARPRGWYPPYPAAARPTPAAAVPPQPNWTAGIDPLAGPCDAATRLRLIDALAALRTPWAEALLHRALSEETDVAVRTAALRALRPWTTALARDAVQANEFAGCENVLARHELELRVRSGLVEPLE